MRRQSGCKVIELRRAEWRQRVRKPQGVDAAMFTAELSALCMRTPGQSADALVLAALRAVREPRMYSAIERATIHALCGARFDATGLEPGSDEQVLALSVFAFVSAPECVEDSLLAILKAGGSTAREGALVSSWFALLGSTAKLEASNAPALDYAAG